MTINRCILLSCLATVLLANTSCLTKKVTLKPVSITATRDSDLDGVNDANDKCPDIKGLAKLDGCPDTDGDGIADYHDKCPEVVGQARYQGCPVPDTDKDGINDDSDECPTVFGYARYQGCLIPDTDGDGVNEEEDKCPQEAGPASNKGCPFTNKSDSLSNKDTDGDGVDDLADNCLNVPGPASNKGCPLAVNIKVGPKSGQKKQGVLFKSTPATSKAHNGLTNKRPATADKKIMPGSGDETKTTSVNRLIIDSVSKTVNPVNTLPGATLRFSFPNTMIARETKNLVIELIVNEIPGHAAKQTVPVYLQKSDSTTSISLPGVAAYKKLTISFLYNKQLIQITPSVPEAQEPDLTKGNSWHWKMEALKSTSGVDTITLQVNGETAEGLKLTIAQQRVNIQIAPGPLVSFWSGAGKWIVSVGLIALSAIFLFLFTAKSKRKKQTP